MKLKRLWKAAKAGLEVAKIVARGKAADALRTAGAAVGLAERFVETMRDAKGPENKKD